MYTRAILFLALIAGTSLAQLSSMGSYEECVLDNMMELLGCTANLAVCFNITESGGQIDMKKYCPCFTEFLKCYVDLCPDMQSIFDEWSQNVDSFCGEWTIPVGCYFQVFNDPHIMRLYSSGSAISWTNDVCDSLNFPHLYNSETLHVSGTAAHWDSWEGAATAMNSVVVTIKGVSWTYSVSATGNATEFDGTNVLAGVSVSPKRISLIDTSESVTIVNRGTWINVEIYGNCNNSGRVSTVHDLSGCPTSRRRATYTEHPECADLPDHFKEPCNLDLDWTGGDQEFAASAHQMHQKAVSAEALIKQFGGAGSLFPALAAVVLAVAAALF